MIVSVLATCVVSPTARAECTTTNPRTGVSVDDCSGPDRVWFVLRIDLAAGDVALRVSRPAERAQRLDTWSASVEGAVASIQAGNFDFPSYRPTGLTVGEGEAWSETADDGRTAVLAFDDRSVGIVVPPEQVVPAEAWMHSVVSGPHVLRDGVPIDTCVGRGCERTSRTGVALDESGHVLIAVVAEGDRPETSGVTDPELGALLRDAGGRDGIRTGDGATSALWVDGNMSSTSSDGTPRPAAAFLTVVDRASGVTTRLRGVVGIEGSPDEFLLDSTVTVTSLDGREVARGMPITDGGYWEYTLPVRDYIVRASNSGYRTSCKLCEGTPSADTWCSLFLAPGEGAETCNPPPRTLDVGPWPEAPADPDAGVDAGADAGDAPTPSNGCSAGGPTSAAWLVLACVWYRRPR